MSFRPSKQYNQFIKCAGTAFSHSVSAQCEVGAEVGGPNIRGGRLD